MAAPTWQALAGPSGPLMVHLAPGHAASDRSRRAAAGAPRAPAAAGGSPPPAAPASTVVLVHDFPLEEASADRTSQGLPVVADRLAGESGWRVVAGCLRGVGGSPGEFSMAGWLEDLAVLVEHACTLAAGGGVWVVGFGAGGSIALCQAAEDGRIRGVGCLGAPATFSDWARHPEAMLAAARRVGVVRSPDFPPDLDAWAREFTLLRPLGAAAALGSRPLLVVHGAEDDHVAVSDARELAEAAGGRAELHVLPGAGHHLRADPRAMALLVGWLERQAP